MRSGGFHSIPKLVKDYVSPPSLSRTTSLSESSDDVSSTHSQHTGDSTLIRQLVLHQRSRETELQVRLLDILPILRESTSPLRAACGAALGACEEVIAGVNRARWKRGSKSLREKEVQLDEAIETLRREAEAFKAEGRLEVVRPYVALLQDGGTDAAPAPGSKNTHTPVPPIRGLIIAQVFSAHLVVTADSITALCETVRSTSAKRQRARLWAPSKLRALGKWILRRDTDDEADRMLGEDLRPGVEKVEEAQEKPYSANLAHTSSALLLIFGCREGPRQSSADECLSKMDGFQSYDLQVEQDS